MVGAVALELATAAFDAVAIGAWLPGWYALIGVRLAGQPDTGQRDSGQTEPESPKGLPPRDRLSQSLGELIEFVIHNLPFRCCLFFLSCKRTHRKESSSSHETGCHCIVIALSLERILGRVTSLTLRDPSQ
jgi:hypothetical protein